MSAGYLWIKAFHVIFVITWMAALFYLPRLFVHHAMTSDEATNERLKIMERKLFLFITPWAVLTIIFGFWLWFGYGFTGTWLTIKVVRVEEIDPGLRNFCTYSVCHIAFRTYANFRPLEF